MSAKNRYMIKNKVQDSFFNKAKEEGYPARSVYKLKEIDQKYKLIKRGSVVLDLGAAPGSWLMYLSEKVGRRGKVVGIEIQDLKIHLEENVEFIKGDAREMPIKGKFDVVVSDMAPKTTGITFADAFKSLELAEAAFKITKKVLKPNGHFLLKIFEGEGTAEFVKRVRKHFKTIKRYSPQATRKKSREFYIICKDFFND